MWVDGFHMQFSYEMSPNIQHGGGGSVAQYLCAKCDAAGLITALTQHSTDVHRDCTGDCQGSYTETLSDKQ